MLYLLLAIICLADEDAKYVNEVAWFYMNAYVYNLFKRVYILIYLSDIY